MKTFPPNTVIVIAIPYQARMAMTGPGLSSPGREASSLAPCSLLPLWRMCSATAGTPFQASLPSRLPGSADRRKPHTRLQVTSHGSGSVPYQSLPWRTAYLSMPLRPDAAELGDKQTLVSTGGEAIADRRNVLL